MATHRRSRGNISFLLIHGIDRLRILPLVKATLLVALLGRLPLRTSGTSTRVLLIHRFLLHGLLILRTFGIIMPVTRLATSTTQSTVLDFLNRLGGLLVSRCIGTSTAHSASSLPSVIQTLLDPIRHSVNGACRIKGLASLVQLLSKFYGNATGLALLLSSGRAWLCCLLRRLIIVRLLGLSTSFTP